jgi:hypothetical protein
MTEGIVDDEDMTVEDGTPPDIDDSPEPKNDAVPGEVPTEVEERPDAEGISD